MTALDALHYACDLILVIASALQWNAVHAALEQAGSWHKIADDQGRRIAEQGDKIRALELQLRVRDARKAGSRRKAAALDAHALKERLIRGIHEAFPDG